MVSDLIQLLHAHRYDHACECMIIASCTCVPWYNSDMCLPPKGNIGDVLPLQYKDAGTCVIIEFVWKKQILSKTIGKKARVLRLSVTMIHLVVCEHAAGSSIVSPPSQSTLGEACWMGRLGSCHTGGELPTIDLFHALGPGALTAGTQRKLDEALLSFYEYISEIYLTDVG